MARPLLEAQADHTATSSHAGASAPFLLLLVVAVAAVATVVVSLCTSSKNAKPWKHRGSSSLAPALQLQEQVDGGASTRKQLLASLSGIGGDGGASSRKQLLASLSGIGGKAAAVAKMVSWNRRSAPGSGWSSSDDDDEGPVAEEEALWKKTIIMGDKCRPLEFSGHIAYGSDGKPLQTPPPELIKKGAADAAEN